MGVGIDIIEPCGFLFSDRRLKRSGMDYVDQAQLTRHLNWDSFKESATGKRIILLTPHTDDIYTDVAFKSDDIIMVGRESDGVPDDVAHDATMRVKIPMRHQCRSLNVATAAAMVIGEAVRQTQD